MDHGILLDRADLEWLIQKYREEYEGKEGKPQRLPLSQAILSGVDGTDLLLEGADFSGAQLEGADLSEAQLEGADLSEAQLERANFSEAQLERANFFKAQLERANFFKAQLERANFSSAKMSNTTFGGATIVAPQGVGPIIADATGWDEVNLPIIEWSQIKQLGDEAEAKKRRGKDGKRKDATTRFTDYFAATRAYRQIAAALDGMGRKEEAEKFAYRGQVMQRKMLWWSIWQKKRTFRQRLADGRAWLFSWLLALLSGYGYRFGRSLFWYVGVLLAFAWLYMHISQAVPPHSSIPDHLSWLDVCILSISDMVGRGFFRQDMPTYLSDPYAGWSVLEGMIGVFMDVLLISTLTQRLFKK